MKKTTAPNQWWWCACLEGAACSDALLGRTGKKLLESALAERGQLGPCRASWAGEQRVHRPRLPIDDCGDRASGTIWEGDRHRTENGACWSKARYLEGNSKCTMWKGDMAASFLQEHRLPTSPRHQQCFLLPF